MGMACHARCLVEDLPAAKIPLNGVGQLEQHRLDPDVWMRRIMLSTLTKGTMAFADGRGLGMLGLLRAIWTFAASVRPSHTDQNLNIALQIAQG
ncbi:hypothetical protein A4R28_31580 (plasmid) [Mesorhizobium ciceri]|nr:hypothetical protein A4R28_31580 [Mesorhizobium ciceri]